MGPLISLRNGIDISQRDVTLREYEDWKADVKKKARVKIGDLKDVWYDGVTHYVKTSSVKHINNCDVAEILESILVMWDNKDNRWIKCTPDQAEYKEYYK